MPNAGRNQLQAYLEQLYRANAMNASPELRTPMLHDANLAAQYDAGNYQAPRPPVNYQNPFPGNPQARPNFPGPMPVNMAEVVRGSLARQRAGVPAGIPRPGPGTVLAKVIGTRANVMNRKVPRPQPPSLPHTL